MLNVVLRALALVSKGDSAVEATGRLFEEFAAAGLEHNADSYNAVIEACVGAKKVHRRGALHPPEQPAQLCCFVCSSMQIVSPELISTPHCLLRAACGRAVPGGIHGGRRGQPGQGPAPGPQQRHVGPAPSRVSGRKRLRRPSGCSAESQVQGGKFRNDKLYIRLSCILSFPHTFCTP